jgi:hypothetical protein
MINESSAQFKYILKYIFDEIPELCPLRRIGKGGKYKIIINVPSV